ncbi:MAG: site-specific DNA-methyltransferase [Hyphomicrobiales bacterium]|nr:site-specific DNA-methyltransferase [Hyphomicrobiales bacterium]
MTDSLLGGLRLFKQASPTPQCLAYEKTAVSFEDQVRDFRAFGKVTQEHLHDAIPYLVNEFWTSGQRRAHSLHEVSYRACFKPQLPEFFIERLTRPGDAVHDPFMGRGTTPLQAALMGRRPLGNDINPLSVLLTRPRLRPPSLSDIAQRLDEIFLEEGEVEHGELLAFFSPRTLRQITALRDWLMARAPIGIVPDPIDDWIRMVAINRLTGHSPGFFSVYTLPPNQAVSAQAQRKINEKRGQTPPDRDVRKLILRKSASLLKDGRPGFHPEPQFVTTPSHLTCAIAASSVELVVTSPPFLDVVQYADDNWLRCWFAGIDLGEVAIPQHRTPASWQGMVRDTLRELARIIRSGGHLAFEVGEVRGGKLLLERLVWEAAEGLPFDRLFVMVNQQAFTKTANCWGVSNNRKGTNSNRIVVLRRR